MSKSIRQRLDDLEKRSLPSRQQKQPPPPNGRLERIIRHGNAVIEVWRVRRSIRPNAA